MKILICGGSGYIGTRLAERARSHGTVLCTSSRPGEGALLLDLARPDAFDFGCLHAGDVVLLLAAISAPDICANERPRAWAVNVDGSTRFIERVLGRGARVIFFSSDTVYGQRGEPFDESAACHPAGDYAEMKLEVERRFAGEGGFKAVRLSYVFSRADKFSRYLGSCHRDGAPAEVFDPFVRAVVHREDVVAGVLSLANQWHRWPQQVFNFGGPEALSRVAFAQALRARVWPDLVIKVVTPDEHFFSNRPRSIHMQSPLLAALLGRPPSTLVQAAAFEFMDSPEISLG